MPTLPELLGALEPALALRPTAPLPWLGVPLLLDGLALPPLPVPQLALWFAALFPRFPLLPPLLVSLAFLPPLPPLGIPLLFSGQEGAFTPDRANQKQVTLKMMTTVAISARFKSCALISLGPTKRSASAPGAS
jgi:hypothetical protein